MARASSLPAIWSCLTSSTLQPITIYPLSGIDSIRSGDDLTTHLVTALERNRVGAATGDIWVVAQKIVSKAEGRLRSLSAITPGPTAQNLAAQTHKDPRLVQLILDESTAVVRAQPGVLITRHRQGFVMANAGIDASNLDGDPDQVLLLPEDSDRSAAQLRQSLASALQVDCAVVIADSFGRPFRNGVTNVAIGAAGLPALLDKRAQLDRAGRPLRVTQVALGDLLASAAGLLMGEGNESIPAALLRGLPATYRDGQSGEHSAQDLVRPLEQDLFLR